MLAFLSWPYGGTVAGLVLNLAAVVAVSPVLALLVRCRRRFDALVGVTPAPDGRTRHRLPGVGALDTHLQLGEQDVGLVDGGGREWWLPGPAAGGVASCVVGEHTTCWLDADGALLLVLATDQVAPDGTSRARLAEAAGAVGIEVSADPFHVPASGTPVDLRHESAEPGLGMSEWERGRVGAAIDVLVPLAGVVQLVGAVAAAYSLPPWGYLNVVAGAPGSASGSGPAGGTGGGGPG